MARCENCGHENSPNATFCEECGLSLDKSPGFGRTITPQPKQKMDNSRKALIALIVILAVVFGGMIIYLLVTPSNQSTTTTPTFNNTSTSTTSNVISLSAFPVSEVPGLAEEVSKKGTNFTTITFKGVTLDKNQCLYVLSRGIVMINSGDNGKISVGQYGNPKNPYGAVNSATITQSQYVDMAKRTYTWMDTNGLSPNYIGIKVSGQADLSPDNLLKVYSKVLTQYKSTGKLPASVTLP